MFSNCQCGGFYNSSHHYLTNREAWLTRVIDLVHQVSTGPSDILICLGAFHRLRVKRVSQPPVSGQQRTLLMVVLFTYISSILIYLPSFWQYEHLNIPCEDSSLSLTLNTNSTDCHFYQPSYELSWMIYASFQLVVMKVIPLVSVILMDFIIIKKLVRLKRRYAGIVAKPTWSVFEVSEGEEDGIGRVNSISLKINQEERKKKQLENKVKLKIGQMLKEVRRLRVLILILTSYILFTVPNTVTMSCWMYGASLKLWEQDGITFRVLTGSSSLLLTFKYSSNFYLYCIAYAYIIE